MRGVNGQYYLTMARSLGGTVREGTAAEARVGRQAEEGAVKTRLYCCHRLWETMWT